MESSVVSEVSVVKWKVFRCKMERRRQSHHANVDFAFFFPLLNHYELGASYKLSF